MVTGAQKTSKDQVTFDGNFDCGPDRVSAEVILSKGLEPLGLRNRGMTTWTLIDKLEKIKPEIEPESLTLWGDL